MKNSYSDSQSNSPVVHNQEQQRFEIRLHDKIAQLDYVMQDHSIVYTHTEVPAEWEGQGMGSKLAVAGLDYARLKGLKVVAACPFVRAFIAKHKDYQDLT